MSRSSWALTLLLPAALAYAPCPAGEGSRPLDLSALLAEAEAANPQIRVVRARAEALGYAPAQSEALPDPELAVSYRNDSVTAFTLGESADTELTLTWTQEVPYPGKRRLAGDVARADLEVASREIEGVRLGVLAAVKGAYADLLRLDRTRALLTESRTLLLSFRDTSRARYESGEGILENVLKAQTELTRIDAELQALAQERRRSEARLLALLGRGTDAASNGAALGEAAAEPALEPLSVEALEAAALSRAPEIELLRSRVGREERRRDLAERALKPDFTWSAAYTNRGDLDPMVMGAFGVRLPLYSKGKQAQALAQTEADLGAARHELGGGEVRIGAEVRDLHARAERAATLARLYGDGVVPQARSALEAAAASYAVGRAEFLTLIQDFLAVLTYEIDYEAQRTERIQAWAALEPLTGLTLVRPGDGAEPSGVGHE